MRINLLLLLVALTSFFAISVQSAPITNEWLEKAMKLGSTFTQKDLTSDDLDLKYDSETERFYPTERLKAKLASFGDDGDAKFDYREAYPLNNKVEFDMIIMGDNHFDLIQIKRIPYVIGRVQFSGSLNRYEGTDIQVLLGKNSDLPLDSMFTANFEWKTANPTALKDHLKQFYIRWIGVNKGYNTGGGIGTPAVRSLVKFVEDNKLADLITVDARTSGSQGVFRKLDFTPVGIKGKYPDISLDTPIPTDNNENYNFYKIVSEKGKRVISKILEERAEK